MATTFFSFSILRRLRRLTDPALTVLVVLEAIALFVNVPLTDLEIWPIYLDLPLEILIVAAAVVVVSWHRTAVTALVLSFAASVASAAFRDVLASHISTYIDFGAKITFVCVLTWIVGLAVFSPGRITSHRVRGAVAIYLQLSLFFALLYLFILTRHPDAFRPIITLSGPTADVLRGAHGGTQMVYFSLSTLTTTGYGDIVPVHPFARSLANLESLLGQLFPAVFLARLVTLEVADRRA
jgi:hypothetical protein